jgi:hypothetical protein
MRTSMTVVRALVYAIAPAAVNAANASQERSWLAGDHHTAATA